MTRPLYLAFGTEDPQLFKTKEELLKELSGELIDKHLDGLEPTIKAVLEIQDDLMSVAGRWVNVTEDMLREAELLSKEYLINHYRAEWDELVTEKEAEGTFEAYLCGRM